LRFSSAFKNKVLSCLFHDPEFYAKVSPYITPEFFETQEQVGIYRMINEYYMLYKKPPTRDYLIDEIARYLSRHPNLRETKRLWAEVLTEVLHRPQDEQYVKDQLSEFLRRDALAKASRFVIENLESADWETLSSMVKGALNVCTPNGYEGTHVLRDTKRRVLETLEQPDLRLPTGISAIDKIIGGGLSPGEVGVVVALPGVGKSLSLVNIGFGAALKRKRVVFYSLEMNEKKIVARFDSLLTGFSHDSVYNNSTEVLKRLGQLEEELGDILVVKYFPAGTVGVSDLALHLDHLERVGFGPEVVIVDYLTLLRPDRRRNNLYEEVGSICRSLKGLAGERELVVWTAAQANRKAVGAEKVDARYIADSFRIFADVDVVISLTQTSLEKKIGRVRVSALKVRDRRGGGTETLETDYEHMRLSRELDICKFLDLT